MAVGHDADRVDVKGVVDAARRVRGVRLGQGEVVHGAPLKRHRPRRDVNLLDHGVQYCSLRRDPNRGEVRWGLDIRGEQRRTAVGQVELVQVAGQPVPWMDAGHHLVGRVHDHVVAADADAVAGDLALPPGEDRAPLVVLCLEIRRRVRHGVDPHRVPAAVQEQRPCRADEHEAGTRRPDPRCLDDGRLQIGAGSVDRRRLLRWRRRCRVECVPGAGLPSGRARSGPKCARGGSGGEQSSGRRERRPARDRPWHTSSGLWSLAAVRRTRQRRMAGRCGEAGHVIRGYWHRLCRS